VIVEPVVVAALIERWWNRTARGPRQRTVAYLGQLDEAGRLGVQRAAQGNQQSADQQLQLWEDDAPPPEWVEVNAAGVRGENRRAFGNGALPVEMYEGSYPDNSHSKNRINPDDAELKRHANSHATFGLHPTFAKSFSSFSH
jgi:hypothetical protein